MEKSLSYKSVRMSLHGQTCTSFSNKSLFNVGVLLDYLSCYTVERFYFAVEYFGYFHDRE